MESERVNEMCEELVEAFQRGLDDPVSLATLIEMFVEEVDAEGSLTQKQEFLSVLAEQLEAHVDVVFKISWDLPTQLFKFITGHNIKTYEALRKNLVIPQIMKCFMSVTVHGDPRELLLQGSELLSNINGEKEIIEYEAIERSEPKKDLSGIKKEYLDRSSSDFFIGIKVHILYELISTSLKRIETLYPSKYLGIAVVAFEKLITKNSLYLESPLILLRRAYLFCRNYEPNPPPEQVTLNDGENIDKDRLDQIIQSERLLQNKLLRRLCTDAVSEGLKSTSDRSEFKYVEQLTGNDWKETLFYSELIDIKHRLYDLAISFDIDLKGELLKSINEAKRIYQALPTDEDVPTMEAKKSISKGILKLSLSYQLQKITIDKNLDLDPNGAISLCSLYYYVTNKHIYPDIPIEDAIYLYLKFVSPSILSKAYTNLSVEGAIRYFIWVHITHAPCVELRESCTKIPSFVLFAFLECFLIRACQDKIRATRLLQFTLLTRLLCCIPEDIAFEFIHDSLLNFPFPEGKLYIVGVLKDLFLTPYHTKKKSDLKTNEDTMKSNSSNYGKSTGTIPTDDEDITTKLSGLKIEESSQKQKEQETFITLTQERMTLINQHFVSILQSEENKPSIQVINTYMDLFIALKEKWDKDMLAEIKNQLSSISDPTIKSKLSSL